MNHVIGKCESGDSNGMFIPKKCQMIKRWIHKCAICNYMYRWKWYDMKCNFGPHNTTCFANMTAWQMTSLIFVCFDDISLHKEHFQSPCQNCLDINIIGISWLYQVVMLVGTPQHNSMFAQTNISSNIMYLFGIKH